MTHLYLYLILINAISFISFGLDKMFAKLKKRRISEKTLLCLSVLGGALGSLLGMVLFNHKTSKPRFRYTVPIIFLIYLFVSLYQLI